MANGKGVENLEAVRAGARKWARMRFGIDDSFEFLSAALADHLALHVSNFENPEVAKIFVQDLMAEVGEKLKTRGHMVELRVHWDAL